MNVVEASISENSPEVPQTPNKPQSLMEKIWSLLGRKPKGVLLPDRSTEAPFFIENPKEN